jgi:hypothetical protein
MEETVNKKLALEELQRVFDKKFAASDILDGKLQSMLNFLSVIVAIAPTIAGSTLFDKIGWTFWIPIFAVLILYLICFQKIMRGLNPSDYVQPITSDWDILEKRLFKSTPDQAISIIISSYIEALKDAGIQNLNKEKIIRDVFLLTRWIVVLLLASVPIGLWIPSPNLIVLFKQVIDILFKVKL